MSNEKTKPFTNYKMITLPIKDIQYSEDSLRTHNIEDENIQILMEDINQRGLLNVPTVTLKNGKYIVVDGARRITAMKELVEQGKFPEKYNFQLKEEMSPVDVLTSQIAGNFQIHKTTSRQYIEALYKVATEGKYTIDELSKLAGIGKQHMFKLFKTLHLPEEITKMAETGKVSIANLIALADLKQLPVEDLKLWVEKAAVTNAKQFAIDVTSELDNLRAAARGIVKEKVFELTPKLLSKEEILAKLIKSEQEFFGDKKNKVLETRYNIMQELFQIDDQSARIRKNAFDNAEREKELKQKARKESREADKLEKWRAALVQKNYKVEAPKK